MIDREPCAGTGGPAAQQAVLALPGPAFQFDYSEGEFSIAGQPLYIHEQSHPPNSNFDGTGFYVWDAAAILAKFLDSAAFGSAYWAGRRVIELGAGTGIVGISAAVLGARVTVTDLPAVVDLLERNTRRNAGACAHAADVQPLDWFNQADVDRLSAQEFDAVLGSDIVFALELVPPLVRVVHALLSHPRKQQLGGDGCFWMSHKTRSTMIDRAFFDEVKRNGLFAFSIAPACYAAGFSADGIQVYCVSKRFPSGIQCVLRPV